MLTKCYSCGNMYDGSSCPTCAQLKASKRIAEAAEAQLEQSKEQARRSDYESRKRREEDEERIENNERKAIFEKMIKEAQMEFEQTIKDNFAQIVLIIQTNNTNTIESAFKSFCKGKFNTWTGSKSSGGEFSPERAKLYRRHLTDYIISSPNKAEEISVVMKLFETYAEVAKRINDKYEAEEEAKKLEKRKIEEEAERIASEQQKKEYEEAVKKNRIWQIVFGVIAVGLCASAYLHLFEGWYLVGAWIGAFIFGLKALGRFARIGLGLLAMGLGAAAYYNYYEGWYLFGAWAGAFIFGMIALVGADETFWNGVAKGLKS